MCDVGYLYANFSFLDLSVPDLGPIYATDRRQTDVRRQTKASLNAPPIRGGHNNVREQKPRFLHPVAPPVNIHCRKSK